MMNNEELIIKIKELEENQVKLLENIPIIIKNVLDKEYPHIKNEQMLKKIFKGKNILF